MGEPTEQLKNKEVAEKTVKAKNTRREKKMIEKILQISMGLTSSEAMKNGDPADIIAYARFYTYAWVIAYILLPLIIITGISDVLTFFFR
ncbi:MAG: hypothetical protein NTV58_03815 [Deltaproteobacteria bacterium]|nr:hypothetical protein [Deltaproteobacteria bacterium]